MWKNELWKNVKVDYFRFSRKIAVFLWVSVAFFTSFLPLRNKFTFSLLCSAMYNYTPFSWSCIKYIALHNIIQYYNMKQQNTFWNSTLTRHIIYFLRKEFKQIFLRYRNVKYKLVTVHINSRLSMPKKRNCILTAPFFWHLIMFRCRIPLPVLPYTVSYNTQSHISKFCPLRFP